MMGVPLTVNRGVPRRHEGMLMSRSREESVSRSSIVRGRNSSPGFDMTILKAPGSESLETVASWIVLSERARWCFTGRFGSRESGPGKYV